MENDKEDKMKAIDYVEDKEKITTLPVNGVFEL